MCYLVYDTEYYGVYKANPSHSHKTQQEEVGIAIQLKVSGFGVKDGAHQLALGCAEPLMKKEKEKKTFQAFISQCFVNIKI